MAITRKRINVANARTMTPDTKVLGASVSEWSELFTGNFVRHLEADRKRGEELRRNEQAESIHRNIARAELEGSTSTNESRVRLVRVIVGSKASQAKLRPVTLVKSSNSEGFSYFKLLRTARKATQNQATEKKKAQHKKTVQHRTGTVEKTGVNLFETEISR